MLKRINMLALIVLLIFQTMIAPIAATAQTIEYEGTNIETSENLDSIEEVNVLEENEKSENDLSNAGEESAKDDTSGDVKEENIVQEDPVVVGEPTENEANAIAYEDDSNAEAKAGGNVEESVKEETNEPAQAGVEENTPKAKKQVAAIAADSVDLGNIFTFESFKKQDEDTPLEDGAEIDFNSTYQVQYKWDTTGLDVKAGDTATLQLPDVFKHWPENTPARPIVAGAVEVGTYTISNGELKFVFNEAIEDSSIHNGYAGLILEFDQEKFKEDWYKEIDFDGDGNKDLTVVAKPIVVNTELTKEGHPDKDKDAREITWTVDFVNGSEEAITNGVLKDILPEGVGEPRDFIVREFTFDFEGKKVPGDEVSFNEPAINGNEFELTFDSVPARGGYTVEYTTKITDYTISTFTNKATFTADNVNLDANTTVTTGERSNPIQKSGERVWWSEEPGDKINWKIVVNENGQSIGNAIVHDELPKGLTIVDGSIKVTKNGQEVNNIDVTGFPGTPIILGEINDDEKFEITFTTDIDWLVVNDGKYSQKNIFTNETILTEGENPIGEADATVEFWRENLLSKSGNASDYNYDDKVLTWTLEVNKAKHPINQAQVTDILPAGLDIKKSDIVIKNEAGEVVSADSITTTPLDEGRTEVKIVLGDIGTETLKITYTTEVEDFKADSFTNEATLEGDGIGENTPKDSETVTPPGNVYKKDFKGIDYSEKTIDWSITVDPRREAITELVITDTFPNNGMILLPDSVVVKIGGTDLVKGTDYTLVPNTVSEETGYNKGFTIQLNESSEYLPLNEMLTVDFKTSYDSQLDVDGNTIDKHTGDPTFYKNHAAFTGETVNGHDIDEEDDAETKVRQDSWNSGKKEGQLIHVNDEGNLVEGWESGSERKIAWQLYTNYQKQDLGTDVVIKDTLDYEGEIDKDSVKVFVYKVNKDGSTEITDQELSPDKYDLDVKGKEFTLTFKGNVSERYVVTFTTTVPDISQQTYTNNATVELDGKGYPYSGSVNYDQWNDYLNKNVIGHQGNQVFIGEELEWEVTANRNLSVIKDATIVDTISAGLTYVDDSLTIIAGDGSTLVKDTDYELDVANEDGSTKLSIKLKDDLTQSLTLKYKTVVVAENGVQVNNKVDLSGKQVENKSKETNKLTAKEFSWVGGELNPNRGAIKAQKVDSSGEVITTGEAQFELWFELNGERVQFGDRFTTKDGVLEIGNLPLRTYYLQEVEAPAGYVLSDKEIEIVVDKTYNNNPENIFAVDFENIAESDVVVQKVWEDAKNQDGIRPDWITVKLLANGEETGKVVELSEDNEWSAAFTGLSPIDEYTVEEVAVEGYVSTITGSSEEGFVITNSYEPETIKVEGTKTWNDANNQDGKRPEFITVRLLADGKEIADVKVTESTDWKYAFTDLPKFENGKEINYTVQEEAVEGYSTEINGFNITNSYTPGKTSINVVKSWEDNNNQDGMRPESISVKLVANGKVTDKQVELNEANNWQADFTDLDVNADGKAIVYTVEEVAVEGYETSISKLSENSFIITNTHEPEKINIEGTKTWNDANNQDGKRPATIIVRLFANGEEIAEAEVGEVNEWKYAFTNLTKFKNGEEINYTIKEDNVGDYSTEIKGFDITNSYTPEVLDVTVNKIWDDANNQDGKRSDLVTVNLLANGEVIETIEVTAEKDWTHTFKQLPKFENGVEIKYSVQEEKVKDYSSTIDGLDITNSYTPGKTSVNVLKVWEDADNQNDRRPESIVVILLADGEATDQKLILNEANDWQGDFLNLDEYKDGQQIKYTIKEVAVDEYRTAITGDSETGFVITNTLKTYAIGDYTWIDSNKDGIQDENEEVLPDVIVELYDESGENKLAETTTDENGLYIFDELPAGKYTVKFNLTEEQAKKYKFTKQNADEDSTQDSDADPATGWTKVIELNDENEHLTTDYTDQDFKATEGIDPTWDAGVIEKTYAIGDYTWIDRNKDGIQDDNEEPLEGVTVELFDKNGEKVAETETDKNGRYIFDELESGDYKVKFTLTNEQAKKYKFTQQNTGDGPTADSDADEKGWTKEISLNDDNKQLTKEYKDQAFKSTEGIDPTWDAGVIELIDITITKKWVDKDQSIRPDAITVDLLANGEKVSDHKVTADSKWTLTIEGLDKYDANGEEIVYTIEEHIVSEYNTLIDGFDITNTRKTYAIGDYTWIDSNKDGIQNEDEEPLVGVKVELFDEKGEKVAETTTDKNGRYIYDELESGNYKVKFTLTEEQAKKYKFTKQNTDDNSTEDSDADLETGFTKVIELNETNEHLTKDYKDQDFKATEGIDPTWDAGVIKKTYAIGDYTWIDSNKDGIQEKDEKVLPGVKVELFDEEGNKIAETKTDENGRYIFDELESGNYKVKFTLTKEQAKKYKFTKQNAGDDSTKDSDAGEDGWTIVIELNDDNAHLTKDYKDQDFKATEGIDPTWDAGVIEKTYAIGDYTWIDSNKDGIQDEDEEVLPGVKVELFDEEGNKIAETVTDENGRYIFDELPAGKYKVKFTLTKEQAKKYKFTKQNAGDDSTKDSDAGEDGWTVVFELNDDNKHLTKDYKDQDFKATEGIDSTWDAGVVEIEEQPKEPEPVDPKPTDPKPENPKPEKPSENGKPTDSNNKGEGNLPNTATNMFDYLLSGFALILLGSVTLFVRKRKQQ